MRLSAAAASAAVAAATPLWKLGLFFLKVGAILYGGGYMLVRISKAAWCVIIIGSLRSS